jgi:hypothetical protein
MDSITRRIAASSASEMFLRQASTPTPEADKDKLRLHLSFGTDAINHILVAAGCPERYRSYIDCIVGLSEGRHEFEARDKDVAARVRPDEQSTSKGAARQWLKRTRRDFEAWQEERGFNFIECRHGYIEHHTDHAGRKSKIFHSSHYRLHILANVEKVISEAQKNLSRWEDNPLREIELAASKEVLRLSGGSGWAFPGRSSSQMPWYVEIKGYLKTADTFLDKTTQAIPEGAELYGQYEDLVRKIHRQAARLLEMIQS